MEGAQLNALLRTVGSAAPNQSDFLLVMAEFILLLKADRDHRSDPNFKEPGALRTVEADVLGGKRWVLGILNISNVHWTAYAINVWDGEVKYGDSQGSGCRMPVDEEIAIWGWVHKLRQQMQLPPLPSQVVGWLPVNVQPDGYSCGLFAINAIEAFIGSRSLICSTVRDVCNYRIELALRTIRSTSGKNVRNADIFQLCTLTNM